MKFGQLIENNESNICLQKSRRKRGREASSRPVFVFRKAVYEVKEKGLELSFNIF